jgi:hypothetical protein
MFDHVIQNVNESDIVCTAIYNEGNQNDKTIGISFRRKDQISGDVIWSVFEKVAQSNSRFNALDKLAVTLHSVRMPAGFGGDGIKTRGRLLSVMAHLKSIVEVKAKNNCLAHALIIATAKLTNNPNYIPYRQGRKKILPVDQHLLETTGIELDNGAGIPGLIRFQEHFHEYNIVV